MDDLLDGKVEVSGPAQTQDTLKILDHFKGLEEAALDHERPSPAWCAELYEVQAQLETLKAREAKLKEVVKKHKDRGSFIHGSYCLKITERAGSKTLDKDALVARLEAELGADEAKVYVQECTKQGKPSVVISVEKIGNASGDGLSGGVAGEGGGL